MKKTCGELYLEALLELPTEGERQTFAMGFVSGQAEKVYLGACPAAMFRPSEEIREWLVSVVAKVCQRYGLRYIVFDFKTDAGMIHEIWIHRYSTTIGEWYVWDKDSPEWHRLRARACGIPDEEVDEEFHRRKAYNKPCDQGALVQR